MDVNKPEDIYKEEIKNQWNNDPCGSHYTDVNKESAPLEWFMDIERHRYADYAPWMPGLMEFDSHAEKKVLEVGAGLGTDLAQFAKNNSIVTDIDLSSTHLNLAKHNFSLRRLKGNFILQDAEVLPFEDNEFDVIYSNGVIHHTPNTSSLVKEMYRVLKPGGRIIIMVYATYSLHFWYQLVWKLGVKNGLLDVFSIGEIMSRNVEISDANARPLVKVYTAKQLRKLFINFANIKIYKRQLTKSEVQIRILRLVPLTILEKLLGWNLILKAHKPTLNLHK